MGDVEFFKISFFFLIANSFTNFILQAFNGHFVACWVFVFIGFK